MSTVEQRTKITTRHEYLVPKPANQAEIGKALAWAKRDMEDANVDHTYDDSVWFDADDDHVTVYWEEEA